MAFRIIFMVINVISKKIPPVTNINVISIVLIANFESLRPSFKKYTKNKIIIGEIGKRYLPIESRSINISI